MSRRVQSPAQHHGIGGDALGRAQRLSFAFVSTQQRA
jgi:hypothetical protein